MCIKKKHIGAFKDSKIATAEGVCQKIMAGIKCIYLSCRRRRRTSQSAVPCETGQDLPWCTCHSEINIQYLVTKEITVRIKEAQGCGRQEKQ